MPLDERSSWGLAPSRLAAKLLILAPEGCSPASSVLPLLQRLLGSTDPVGPSLCAAIAHFNYLVQLEDLSPSFCYLNLDGPKLGSRTASHPWKASSVTDSWANCPCCLCKWKETTLASWLDQHTAGRFQLSSLPFILYNLHNCAWLT